MDANTSNNDCCFKQSSLQTKVSNPMKGFTSKKKSSVFMSCCLGKEKNKLNIKQIYIYLFLINKKKKKNTYIFLFD